MNIKVLHIVAGSRQSGAAKGVLILHESLLKKKIDSKVLIQNSDKYDPHIVALSDTALTKMYVKLLGKIDRSLLKFYRNRDRQLAFNIGWVGYDVRKHPLYQWADIIHFHWINHGMINIKILKKIKKPIIWTIRDMWPITGGCHTALDCDKYQVRCGACPQLGSKSDSDLSRFVWKRKKKYYDSSIHLVALSQWMGECIKSSSLMADNELTIIGNGIDIQKFYPVDKITARESLNLPLDKKIVLAGAINHAYKHKGLHKYIEAIPHLNSNECLLLFFGETHDLGNELQNFQYRDMGLIQDVDLLRKIYSAADVFVAPSLQESFGKTLAEAMACGTPVVAFNYSGPKDIVLHQSTGYLAIPFDPEDLGKGINWVIENNKDGVLSIHAVNRVKENFSMERIADQYIDLYKKHFKEAILTE